MIGESTVCSSDTCCSTPNQWRETETHFKTERLFCQFDVIKDLVTHHVCIIVDRRQDRRNFYLLILVQKDKANDHLCVKVPVSLLLILFSKYFLGMEYLMVPTNFIFVFVFRLSRHRPKVNKVSFPQEWIPQANGGSADPEGNLQPFCVIHQLLTEEHLLCTVWQRDYWNISPGDGQAGCQVKIHVFGVCFSNCCLLLVIWQKGFWCGLSWLKH